METQPAFGLRELLTHVVGDIARALCQREGETPRQRYDRTQAAAHTVMAFTPRDAIEAMLAGHCVMFHEMIVDSVNTTMGGEETAKRRGTRSNIVAMDKAFGNNLERLERYQSRQAQGLADAKAVKAPGEAPGEAAGEAPGEAPGEAHRETDIGDRVRRHQAKTPPPESRTKAAPAPAEAPTEQAPAEQASVVRFPSPEAVRRALPIQKRWPLSMPAIPRGLPRRWGSSNRATPIWLRRQIKWRISNGRRQ